MNMADELQETEELCPFKIKNIVKLSYATSIHCPRIGLNISLRLVPDGSTVQRIQQTDENPLFQIPMGMNVILKLTTMEYFLVRENGEVFVCNGNPDESFPQLLLKGLFVTKLKLDRCCVEVDQIDKEVDADGEITFVKSTPIGSLNILESGPENDINVLFGDSDTLHLCEVEEFNNVFDQGISDTDTFQNDQEFSGLAGDDSEGNKGEENSDGEEPNEVLEFVFRALESDNQILSEHMTMKKITGVKKVRKQAVSSEGQKAAKRDKQRFTCEMCGEVLNSRNALGFHAAIHEGYRPFKCSDCDQMFRQYKALRQHRAKWHSSNPRPHLCNMCGKAFHTAFQLGVHIRRHTGDKRHKCTYCDKAFVTRDARLTHEAIHEEKKFLCDLCGRGYNSNQDLRRHLKLIHPDGQVQPCGRCTRIACICGERHWRSRRTNSLEGGVRLSQGRYQCGTCQGIFFNKSGLIRHLKRHQSLFQCRYCLADFTSTAKRKKACPN